MTNSALTPLLDTLTSLQDWAVSSMQYVKRRTHLSAEEKQDVYDKFEQYEYYFHKLIKGYTDGSLSIDAEAISLEIERHLQRQAQFNGYARYYEFPRYSLPDSIPPTKPFDYIAFQVLDNAFEPVIWKGAYLICSQVNTLAELKQNDLLVIRYRRNYRTARKNKIGWFHGVEGNWLALDYTLAELHHKKPRWSVSLFEVVDIYRVNTISRDWNE